MKEKERAPGAVVGSSIPHDSARAHVTGEARFVDDLPEPAGTLFVALGCSPHAHARIRAIDLRRVRSAPGVVAVLTAEDVPGVNDVGPLVADDPILAVDEVEYAGQPVFAVAATTIDHARRAVRRAGISYEPRPAVLTIDDARKAGSLLGPTRTLARGRPGEAVRAAANRLRGRLEIGGQDHFYLETQISLAVPQEGGGVRIHSSTQNPSEVQRLVARALGVRDHEVSVEVRRMGGGFGGKESQAARFAAIASLVAVRTGRPVKIRLDRREDMSITGKRHDFVAEYDVGFDGDGRIEGLSLTLFSRCGATTDLSEAVNDRALLHVDNAYFLPNVRVRSVRLRTHTVSNTACRGFGAPQAMLVIENVLDDVARALGREPLAVRRRNFYSRGRGDETPYGQRVEDSVVRPLVAEIARTSRYRERRAAARRFNRLGGPTRRGIALTPVKFGISFVTTHLNQAGALLHVYADGSVHLNHGGTEMGQGLYVKVAQLVADELGVGLDRIKITAADTAMVPNTSPTAASVSTDLNGAAACSAARVIRERLAGVAAERLGVSPRQVVFVGGRVRGGKRSVSFEEVARQAHTARISLSATGFHRTPKIHFDPRAKTNRPFLYFAYGAAVSEVEVDVDTGEARVLRVDVLHDAGRSINPAVDRGQIEGGFVQGMGWLTTEELVWDEHGVLGTDGPSDYKIPVSGDVPEHFEVRMYARSHNRERVPASSKGVGEPPLPLAISVFLAIRDAVASTAGPRARPALDAPATRQRILATIAASRDEGRT